MFLSNILETGLKYSQVYNYLSLSVLCAGVTSANFKEFWNHYIIGEISLFSTSILVGMLL